MRPDRSIPILLALAVALLGGCAGTPPQGQSPTQARNPATEPSTTVSQQELQQQPEQSTSSALLHSTAGPYLSGR